MVPPSSDRMARVPPYSRIRCSRCPVRGCHPLRPAVPGASGTKEKNHWPRPLSLATTRGSRLMSFPPATEMFQFAGFASLAYEFSQEYPFWGGLPHSEIPGQRSLASPPGFSQRAASFIASQCQGIHRMPFVSLDQETRSAADPLPGANPNRRPRTPPRTGASPQLASLLAGRPVAGIPVAAGHVTGKPAAVLAGRQRAASLYEDTCPDGPQRRPGRPQACACRQPARCPRLVRLGHIRKSVSPVNQHRPGTRSPGKPPQTETRF